MTLRDYLATQAMREILRRNVDATPMDVAVMSYCIADSMLEVGQQTEEGTEFGDIVMQQYSGYDPLLDPMGVIPEIENGKEEHMGHTVSKGDD